MVQLSPSTLTDLAGAASSGWSNFTPSLAAAAASSLPGSSGAGGLSGFYAPDPNDFGSGPPWDFSTFNEDKPRSQLDKDDFLTLFVEQLQHQDPMNPMNPDQMVAQLATFSQLEQAYETNKHLAVISAYQASINSAQSLSLLGREVETAGELITLDDSGRSSPAGYILPDDANVTITIYDHTGEPVRTIELGQQMAGRHDVVWDGAGDDGQQLPAGPYFFKVAAYGEESDFPMEVVTICQGPVTGIRYTEDGIPMLLVGPYDSSLTDENGEPIDARIAVLLSDILKVAEPQREEEVSNNELKSQLDLIQQAAYAAAGWEDGPLP